MMMHRNKYPAIAAILLLIAGAALFTFLMQEQEPVPAFPALVNRDCAPWDGAAFTVSIPHEEQVIRISIYQSPDIRRAVTYSFSDESMRDGIALLLFQVGSSELLKGTVTFQSVEQGRAVEGRFDLTTGTGQRFMGKFMAEWGNEIIYCG